MQIHCTITATDDGRFVVFFPYKTDENVTKIADTFDDVGRIVKEEVERQTRKGL